MRVYLCMYASVSVCACMCVFVMHVLAVLHCGVWASQASLVDP